MEEVVKTCQAEHVTQKARKKAKAKAREKVKKRRIAEKEKKKKMLEYLQQLWDKVLAENATLLEGTEEFYIAGSKCKEITLGDNRDYWSSKKAKGKQLARYHRDIRVKMGRC